MSVSMIPYTAVLDIISYGDQVSWRSTASKILSRMFIDVNSHLKQIDDFRLISSLSC